MESSTFLLLIAKNVMFAQRKKYINTYFLCLIDSETCTYDMWNLAGDLCLPSDEIVPY